ncbi:MAG: ATP-dependent DNA helicase [Candidatus Eisenbacteria bacterium]|nr:ATP-dependent DNA helicase [Candidatus Eisenbacteria bacterium]
MTLARRVEKVFAEDGPLARGWPRYERRDAQVALSIEIARTLEHGGVLLAEAPTGVGKSLAYLVPAALLSRESGGRVVVATCTRSLQDQLVERDLPALLEALGVSLPSARLKGKQNYLCTRSLELEDGPAPDEAELIESLRGWSLTETEGDLDRFECDDPEGFRRLRPRIATDPAACTALTCRRGRECFWTRARRRASEAQLLIVNHALLSLSGESDGLLPEFDALIVDEAHRLEGVLLSQLERSVSRQRFEDLFRLLGSARERRAGNARARGGLLARLRGYAAPLLARRESGEGVSGVLDRLVARITEARIDSGRLFDQLSLGPATGPYARRLRYQSTAELLGGELGALEATLKHCNEFARGLHHVAEAMGSMESSRGEEFSAELDQVSARWTALGSDLDELTQAGERDRVYWRSSGGRGLELHGTPLTAADHARRLVLSRARAAVLTSATLSAAGDFSFLAGRLGIGTEGGLPYEVAIAPSPFPLARQMRAYVYTGGGDEADAVSQVVAELARSGRNQLVLFTAHERLRRAREKLLDRLPPSRLLLAQEWDGPAGLLAERFRAARGAILLGVQSLWEGVDFPGESLEIVVVAKLPFSVPDEPLVEARAERMRERGEDPFMGDAVPDAVLRFRQGIGRLIRRADDRGVVVVCDVRLASASYRRAFVDALPVAAVPWRDAAELADDAARFLGREMGIEEGR